MASPLPARLTADGGAYEDHALEDPSSPALSFNGGAEGLTIASPRAC